MAGLVVGCVAWGTVPPRQDVGEPRCTGRIARASKCVPDFFVIGATKAGSTAAWRNIEAHPCVEPTNKEPHHFTYRYGRGMSGLAETLGCASAPRSNTKLYGDGTPEYIFLPGVAERAKAASPNAAVVAIVRDPIDRAFSHFNMARRSKKKGGEESFEPHSVFEDAIADELRCYGLELPDYTGATYNSERAALEQRSMRAAIALMRARSDETHLALFEQCSLAGWTGLKDIEVQNKMAFPLLTGTYLSRGMYAPQLLRWDAVFGTKAMLVLSQAEFYNATQPSMDRVFTHMGLPSYQLPVTEDQAHREARVADEGRAAGGGGAAAAAGGGGGAWTGTFVNSAHGYRNHLKQGTANLLQVLFHSYNEQLFAYMGRRFESWGS